MGGPTGYPVRWEEVEETVSDADASRLRFGPADVLERARAMDDPFRPVLELKQRLGG